MRPRALRSASCLLAVLAAGCGAERFGPNVLLVTFDTTRADHLSCYGYGKKTSPNLDRLAQEGQRYQNAYAVTSWTLPSHGSLFTGKFPSSHGAQYDPEGKINLVQEGGIRGHEDWSQYRANPLADDEVTLAHILTERGYATHAIVGGPWMKKVFGMDKGFQSYDDTNFRVDAAGTELNGRSAEDITDHAIEFVDEHRERSFFLFLNYYDPHGPYTPEPEFKKLFWQGPPPKQQSLPHILACYDAEIAYTDHHFGRLLDHLRATGLYEETMILVTSDHGELMGDMGGLMGHGDSLSQAEIHIPLIVKLDGENPPRGLSTALVQQVDLFPTILERLGLPIDPRVQGQPLGRADHPVVAEVRPLPFTNDPSRKDWRQIGDWKVLVDGRYKFVWGSRGRHQLYDLQRDPGEVINLVDREPELAGKMQAELEAYFASLPPPGEVTEVQQATAEDLRALEAMGYIGGDEHAPLGEGQGADGASEGN